MTKAAANFEEILDREFRWPRLGDLPFSSSDDWQRNAHVDRHGLSRMVMMMTGYKLAGDLMVKRATAEPGERDALVYPIIFNYRQFVELSLKYLISTYGRTVGIDPIWRSHDLSELWVALMAVLEGYGHEDTDESEPAVATIVAQFAKVDPKSFSYRYPVDTKGNPLPIEYEQLDLSVLANVMQALDGYFTGCDGYLDDLQSAGP